MVDYVKLGMMKAEFDAACRAIDARAAEVNPLAAAFQALMNGDTTERDKQCDKDPAIEDARKKAKIEAWLRIGEKHGFDRESSMAALKRIYQ